MSDEFEVHKGGKSIRIPPWHRDHIHVAFDPPPGAINAELVNECSRQSAAYDTFVFQLSSPILCSNQNNSYFQLSSGTRVHFPFSAINADHWKKIIESMKIPNRNETFTPSVDLSFSELSSGESNRGYFMRIDVHQNDERDARTILKIFERFLIESTFQWWLGSGVNVLDSGLRFKFNDLELNDGVSVARRYFHAAGQICTHGIEIPLDQKIFRATGESMDQANIPEFGIEVLASAYVHYANEQDHLFIIQVCLFLEIWERKLRRLSKSKHKGKSYGETLLRHGILMESGEDADMLSRLFKVRGKYAHGLELDGPSEAREDLRKIAAWVWDVRGRALKKIEVAGLNLKEFRSL